jgi:hypothetical protein
MMDQHILASYFLVGASECVWCQRVHVMLLLYLAMNTELHFCLQDWLCVLQVQVPPL